MSSSDESSPTRGQVLASTEELPFDVYSVTYDAESSLVAVCGAAGLCEAEGSSCTDTCDFSGQTQCWNGTWFQQCGDFDVDPCLEWSSAMPCGGTGNCINGGCEEAPDPPACEFPMAPQEVISSIGATGSGVCDADTILSNDGTKDSWAPG